MAGFIAAQRAEYGVPHALACRALGVSQAWFYKWRHGDGSPRRARRRALSALVAASATAFSVLKWVGAAYLVYVGATMLFARKPADAPDLIAAPAGVAGAGGRFGSESSAAAVLRRGFLTNVLNPKVALFFLAFLPQFVDPARGHAAGQIIILGLLFNTTGTLVNAGVALLASGATGWLHRSEQVATRAQRGAGAVLLALGARLAWTGRTSG